MSVAFAVMRHAFAHPGLLFALVLTPWLVGIALRISVE